MRAPRPSAIRGASAWACRWIASRKRCPIGKGELLRDGTDVAIIAIGVSVWPAVKAAEQLSQEGLSTAVINARFVKPLDQELIVSVAKRVRYVVTVEEGCKMGGFGSAVLEALSEAGVTVDRPKSSVFRTGTSSKVRRTCCANGTD